MKKKLLCFTLALLLLTGGGRAYPPAPVGKLVPPPFREPVLCVKAVEEQPEEPGRYDTIADTITDEELGLLALTIYHEARGESDDCQTACCEVVLNRVLDERFPSTVKEVLYAPGQFSTAQLLTTQPVKEPAALAKAFRVAEDTLSAREYQLPETYVFFATGKVNGKNFIQLDHTYFSE